MVEYFGDEEPDELLAAILFGAPADAEAARVELLERAKDEWTEN